MTDVNEPLTRFVQLSVLDHVDLLAALTFIQEEVRIIPRPSDARLEDLRERLAASLEIAVHRLDDAERTALRAQFDQVTAEAKDPNPPKEQR